jgi:hypothetical protein
VEPSITLRVPTIGGRSSQSTNSNENSTKRKQGKDDRLKRLRTCRVEYLGGEAKEAS